MVRELVENAIGLVREQERGRRRGGGQAPRRGAAARPAGPAARRRSTSAPTARRLARTATSGRARRCGRCWSPASWRSATSRSRSSRRRTPMMFTGMGMEQMDVDLQGMFEKILPKQRRPPRDDRRRGPQGALRAGVRRADQPGEGATRKAIELAENVGHHLPRRDRQGRGQRAGARAPTSRARACSATCCRSSKGRPCRPATATSRPTTSCSSPPARSTAPSPAT